MTTFKERLLFARRLEYKSSWPLQDCVANLRELHHSRDSVFGMGSVEAKLYEVNPERYRVNIQMKRRMGSFDRTTAQLTGILQAEANDKTDFKGEIRVGEFYLGYTVVLLVIAASSLLTFGGRIIGVFGLIVLGYVWWTLFSDRKVLLKNVVGTLTSS